MDIEDILKFAERAVREAAVSIRGYSLAEKIKDKDFGDLITLGDQQVEAELMQKIIGEFPDDGFYSEEGSEKDSRSGFEWILDPIDGTKFYSRKLPLYTISLALKKEGQPVLGVVYSPENEQMFTAAVSQGACCNGEPIVNSNPAGLADSIVCVEMPSRHMKDSSIDWALGSFRLLIDNTQRVRLLGTGSLSLCWTAMGGYDAYVNLGSGSKVWDIAAGLIILGEAGAKITSRDDKIVAADPNIHDKLIELLGMNR